MPVKAPVSACERTAWLISSTLVSLPATIVRSTTEPVGTGARIAKPCSLPWSSGMTSPIAFAAREVLQPLAGGVGVDRRHQPALDADRVVEHLRDRRQAVRRARRVGDDV